MMPAVSGETDPVHRGGHHRQLELVGPQLPGDVDVVGVARAPRGHDRDVVESVCAAAFLAASDLYLHRRILTVGADEKTPHRAGQGGRRAAGRCLSETALKWV